MPKDRTPYKAKHEYDVIKSKPVKLKKDYKFFNQNPLFKFASFLMVFLMWLILEMFYARLFMRFRVRNKHNLKKIRNEGYVLVANHMHVLDAILIGTTMFPRKTYVTMLQSNLGLPVVGPILRVAGGVPIPDNKDGMARMMIELRAELDKNKVILVMPEAAIKPYHAGIRKFMNGAFRFAIDANANILPMVFIYKNPRGLMKFIRKKPNIELHILDPYMIETLENKHETLVKARDEVHEIMRKYFNQHSDIKEAVINEESTEITDTNSTKSTTN